MVNIEPRRVGQNCSIELVLISSLNPRTAHKETLSWIKEEYPGSEVREGPQMELMNFDPAVDLNSVIADLNNDRVDIKELRQAKIFGLGEEPGTSFIKVRAQSLRDTRERADIVPEVHIHFHTDRQRNIERVKSELPEGIQSDVTIPGKKNIATAKKSDRFALSPSVAQTQLADILSRAEEIQQISGVDRVFLKCFSP